MKIFLLSLVFFITGCSALSNGLIKPEFTALKANQDVNAVKLSGDVSALKAETMKLAEKIDLQNSAIAGVNNTISKNETSIGRDNTVSNDTAIYMAQSEVAKYQAKLWKDMFKYCVGALIGIIILLIRQIFVFFNKYMFYKEQTVLRIDSQKELQEVKELRKGVKSK